MELAFVSIVMVTTGLIAHERGRQLAGQSHPLRAAHQDGMRAAGFGLLLATVAAPWLAIGLVTSYVG